MFETVLNNLTSGVFIVNKQLVIVFANRWMHDATSISNQSLHGRYLLDVYPQIKNSRLLAAIQQCLDHRLPSLLSPGLNRRPLPLFNWSVQPEPIDQLVRVIPLEGKYADCCMVEVHDVSSMVKRENLLSAQTKKLTSLASTDELTGIANRRQFNIVLDRDLNQAKENSEPLSLIFMDIDFFKSYNDAYGHQAGDLCLKMVADALRKRVRQSSDRLARYGGEEFCIIMTNTALATAVSVAEDIRNLVESLSILHEGSQIADVVTISLGVASVDVKINESTSGLILKADSALYRAKQGGRNCVYLYDTDGKFTPAKS